MKTITIYSRKGGVGKSTVATHLATHGSMEGLEVMIIDLDPQANSTKWKDLRGEPSPFVISAQASRLENNLQVARDAGAELVIIDTPPHNNDIALKACKVADLVLIPIRPGIFDLQTIPDSLEIAEMAKKPTKIILSAFPPVGKKGAEVRNILESTGIEIAPTVISYRAIFQQALEFGKTARELEPGSKADNEVKALYEWVMSQI